MTLPTSTPQEAETMTFGVASFIRVASSLAAKPPNTTECTAPMRAQASMAINDAGINERAGELCDFVAQGAIGIGSDCVGDRAVIDQRSLLAAALFDMAIEG